MGASGDSSSSQEGISAVDIVCAVLLFAGWVALFLRYGFMPLSVVLALFFALLVVTGLLDRRANRAPSFLSAGMIALWFITLWFMPYGVGPGVTSLGAGGLVAFFTQFFGVGHIAVLLDGLLGALLMFVFGVIAVIVLGLLTGEEPLSPATFLTAMAIGCFLGTMGSLVVVALMLAVLVVFFVGRRVVSSRMSDGMLVPQLYTSGFGSGKKAKPLPVGLALAFATMIVILFL